MCVCWYFWSRASAFGRAAKDVFLAFPFLFVTLIWTSFRLMNERINWHCLACLLSWESFWMPNICLVYVWGEFGAALIKEMSGLENKPAARVDRCPVTAHLTLLLPVKVYFSLCPCLNPSSSPFFVILSFRFELLSNLSPLVMFIHLCLV